MHFGLINAPATLQAITHTVLSDLIDMGVFAYVNDVLIYPKTMEEHGRLVKEVLQRLTAKSDDSGQQMRMGCHEGRVTRLHHLRVLHLHIQGEG